jgi:sulfatase maturation enzyme AslB (radical SAM superfamily)
MHSIDFEITNRCNAKCNFCPRDATPHQGLMTPEIFEQTLLRSAEIRDDFRAQGLDDQLHISLCGLGEPLLNRNLAHFTERVRTEGFSVSISSNAALLDEKRGRDLLDAGLQSIYINVGDIDEAYEAVYQLPFARTRDNIVQFAEMAGDDCQVVIVLVDYKGDKAHTARMRDYWRAYGLVAFNEYEIMNRGGSLFVDHMQFETLPELAQARELLTDDGVAPLCGAPFGFLFVGYDGLYYLCCSDWEKKTPMGSVFDRSFADVTADKLRHVIGREKVCRTCNLDPINRLTQQLTEAAAGTSDDEATRQMVELISSEQRLVMTAAEQLSPGVSAQIAAMNAEMGIAATGARRTIPVIAR